MVRFEVPPGNMDALATGYAPEIMEILDALRAEVFQVFGDAEESVKGAKMMGYVDYGPANNVWVRLSPEDSHVKLYVHHLTADPTGTFKVEGTGKGARHIKFRTTATDGLPEFLAHLKSVIEA